MTAGSGEHLAALSSLLEAALDQPPGERVPVSARADVWATVFWA